MNRKVIKKVWRKSDLSDPVISGNKNNKVSRKNITNKMPDWTDSKLDEIKRKEFNRLRHMVPAIATKPKVPKIAVIEEAIRYIDELHEALAERVKSNGVPSCLSSVDIDAKTSNSEDIRLAIKNWIGNSQGFVAGAVKKRTSTSSSSSSSSDHLDANQWSKADSPSSKTKSRHRNRFAPYKLPKSN